MYVTTIAMAVMMITSGRCARAHSGAIPYRGRYRGMRFSSPAIAEAPANHRMRDGAESRRSCRTAIAEMFVREVGQRASIGRAARLEGLGWNQHGRDEAAADQHHAHDQRGACASSQMVCLMRPRGFSSVSPGSPRTRGITATPVSNPDSPRASFGNSSKATATIITGLPPCCWSSAVPTARSFHGWARIRPRALASDDHVQPEIGEDQHDRQAERFTESAEEDGPEASSRPDRQHAADDRATAETAGSR